MSHHEGVMHVLCVLRLLRVRANSGLWLAPGWLWEPSGSNVLKVGGAFDSLSEIFRPAHVLGHISLREATNYAFSAYLREYPGELPII